MFVRRRKFESNTSLINRFLNKNSRMIVMFELAKRVPHQSESYLRTLRAKLASN